MYSNAQKASGVKFQTLLCSRQHCNTQASAPSKKKKSCELVTMPRLSVVRKQKKKARENSMRHITCLRSCYGLHFFPHSPPSLSPCAFQREETCTLKVQCECTAWSYPRCMSNKPFTRLISSSPEQPAWDGHSWSIKRNLGFWPEPNARRSKTHQWGTRNKIICEDATCCSSASTGDVETDSLLWGW